MSTPTPDATTPPAPGRPTPDSTAARAPTFLARVYLALMTVGWANMWQYRMEMAIWTVWGIVHPLVALAVWTAAAHGRSIAGYTSSDFASYFLLLMIIGHLSMSWDAFEFSWAVRSGLLSAKLLRPIHPVHEAAAYNISFKLMMLVLLVPFWLLLFWWLTPRSDAQWWHIALGAPAIALACVLRFIVNYCVAMVAFWVTKVDAINLLWWSLDQFLGGRLAPLALLPLWLQGTARFAPFRCMSVFPVELLLGRLTGPQIVEGFAAQVVWLAAAYGVFRLMWRGGVRQYSAVGA